MMFYVSLESIEIRKARRILILVANKRMLEIGARTAVNLNTIISNKLNRWFYLILLLVRI